MNGGTKRHRASRVVTVYFDILIDNHKKVHCSFLILLSRLLLHDKMEKSRRIGGSFMPIAKSVKISNLERYHMVCIDSYMDHCIKGRIYNANQKVIKEYESFIQMIFYMEEWVTKMEYPIPEMELRTFPLKENGVLQEESVVGEKVDKVNHIKKGEKATFIVRIQFCQNASWQGSIYWLEEEKEEYFRSVLELMNLMMSAM